MTRLDLNVIVMSETFYEVDRMIIYIAQISRILNPMKSSKEIVAPAGSLKQSRWAQSWYLKSMRLLETRDVAAAREKFIVRRRCYCIDSHRTQVK